ncbi:MAG: hypothetical protein AB8I08_26840 [Sandaracinaceae bacterium]
MRLPILALPIAAMLFASGCYSRARVTFRPQVPNQVVVASSPPPVRDAVVTRPAAPSNDAAWVDGYWKWEGGQWVWNDGHWERGHSGQAWVAPTAEDNDGRVVYHPGYWRAEDEPPAPEYRRPGGVRVSVRPAPRSPRPAAQPPATQPRVSARTSGGDGSVTIRERPAPAPNAHNADPSVAVAVRPAPSTPTATVRPGVNVATTTPRTVVSPNQGANVATTTPRTVVSPNQGANVTTTTPRTVTVPGNQAANTTAPGRPVAPGTVTAPRTGVTVRPNTNIPLSCSIAADRAPRNGLISVAGTFGSNARVQIGGVYAPIVNRRVREMRVRVPGNSGGGIVRVLQDGQIANCGNLSVGR